MQRAIPVSIIRGGSSKAIFIHSKDLPEPGPLRDKVILRVFGSPDPRQIDGLGGADVLTSKLAIIGPPSVEGADVDYTFGQVSFATQHVDYKGNCGNISSAVGPFAIDEGLIDFDSTAKTKLVRIHNTNTGAILKATVAVGEQGAEVEGDVAIAGVPGTGSRVDLDFSATQGSVTGSLLPTGRPVDKLEVPDIGVVEASLVDAGQATVFLRATDVGLHGTSSEIADSIRQSPDILRRLEQIRGVAAAAMGIVDNPADAEVKSPYTPFVVMVTERPSADGDSDLNAVCVFMQMLHQAYPVTGSVATAAAALLPGTLVHEATRASPGPICIRHPSGLMEVDGVVEDGTLMKAALVRTARRLMSGQAFIPWSVWPKAAI